MTHSLCLKLLLVFLGGFLSFQLFAKEHEMNLTLLKSPRLLSPFSYLSLNEWYVHFNITAKLVDLDSDNQIISELASSWSTSQGGKKYRFKLNVRRRWSNGTPITPEQIVRSLTQEAKHKSAKFLPKILKPGPIEEAIYLEGPDTLVFELHSPHDKFLYHLARPEFGILDADSFPAQEYFTLKSKTSGNYKIEEITDNTIVLVPNPYSESIQSRNPQRITFSVENEHSRILDLVRQGTLDFLEAQSDDVLSIAESSGFYTVLEGGFDNLATVQARRINGNQLNAMKVLNDFLDRRLFAVRPKRVAERMVAFSEFPIVEHRTPISIAEAKGRLGSQVVKLQMVLSDEVTSDQISDAELVRSEAAKIGIEISISRSQGQFRSRWEKEDYPLTMTRMGVYAYDDVELLNGYFCQGFSPYASLKGIVCDQINRAVAPGSTPELRKEQLRSAFDRLNRSGRIIALYHFPRRFLIHQRWEVKNYNNLLPFPIFTKFYSHPTEVR